MHVAVLKYLLSEGMLDGSCLTVTGKTLAENVAGVPSLTSGQKVIAPLSNPIKPTGHLQILRGNLAPEGSVAKITGKEGLMFSGHALVYDSEEDMLHALERGSIAKGSVVIIRYEGPQGGPGMPEMCMARPACSVQGEGQGCDMDVRHSDANERHHGSRSWSARGSADRRAVLRRQPCKCTTLRAATER
jgi:dihydroxy-acid dehydratase